MNYNENAKNTLTKLCTRINLIRVFSVELLTSVKYLYFFEIKYKIKPFIMYGIIRGFYEY